MPQETTTSDQLAAEWRQCAERYGEEVRAQVQSVVMAQLAPLATGFYEHMMGDAGASFFLSDQLVKTRLHSAMQHWLQTVFSVPMEGAYLEAVAQQKKIGAVHARIGIPSYLVMRGARSLSRGMDRLLTGGDAQLRAQAVAYVGEIMGLSIEIMCHAYAVQHERNARAEESYRMFAVSQNIGAEKERQRATLLDWENQLMFEMTVNAGYDRLPKLAKSEFGLWFMHKASHAFEGSADVRKILELIAAIDGDIEGVAPGLAPAHALEIIKRIREQSKAIRMLLEGLFDQAGHLESGRDALTRLLNRKYLPVIMAREIDYARKNASGLAVLAIDVDHFKHVNDAYGHDGGDAVLQSLSVMLSQSVRGGDYLFRLGGEEFLVVLVDTDAGKAATVAEKLRVQVQGESIAAIEGKPVRVTLSIGVATHAGHPDYQRLLKAADRALYRAKQNGRNRVELATAQDAMVSHEPA